MGHSKSGRYALLCRFQKRHFFKCSTLRECYYAVLSIWTEGFTVVVCWRPNWHATIFSPDGGHYQVSKILTDIVSIIPTSIISSYATQVLHRGIVKSMKTSFPLLLLIARSHSAWKNEYQSYEKHEIMSHFLFCKGCSQPGKTFIRVLSDSSR